MKQLNVAHVYVSGMNGVEMTEIAVKLNVAANNVRRFIRLSSGCDSKPLGISMAIETMKLT